MKKTYIAPAIVMEYLNIVATPIATSVVILGSSDPISFDDDEIGDAEDVLVKGNSWDNIW